MTVGRRRSFFPFRRLINLGVPLDFPLEFKTQEQKKVRKLQKYYTWKIREGID